MEEQQRLRCHSEDIRSEDETKLTRQHAKYRSDSWAERVECGRMDGSSTALGNMSPTYRSDPTTELPLHSASAPPPPTPPSPPSPSPSTTDILATYFACRATANEDTILSAEGMPAHSFQWSRSLPLDTSHQRQ